MLVPRFLLGASTSGKTESVVALTIKLRHNLTHVYAPSIPLPPPPLPPLPPTPPPPLVALVYDNRRELIDVIGGDNNRIQYCINFAIMDRECNIMREQI